MIRNNYYVPGAFGSNYIPYTGNMSEYRGHTFLRPKVRPQSVITAENPLEQIIKSTQQPVYEQRPVGVSEGLGPDDFKFPPSLTLKDTTKPDLNSSWKDFGTFNPDDPTTWNDASRTQNELNEELSKLDPNDWESYLDTNPNANKGIIGGGFNPLSYLDSPTKGDAGSFLGGTAGNALGGILGSIGGGALGGLVGGKSTPETVGNLTGSLAGGFLLGPLGALIGGAIGNRAGQMTDAIDVLGMGARMPTANPTSFRRDSQGNLTPNIAHVRDADGLFKRTNRGNVPAPSPVGFWSRVGQALGFKSTADVMRDYYGITPGMDVNIPKDSPMWDPFDPRAEGRPLPIGYSGISFEPFTNNAPSPTYSPAPSGSYGDIGDTAETNAAQDSMGWE